MSTVRILRQQKERENPQKSREKDDTQASLTNEGGVLGKGAGLRKAHQKQFSMWTEGKGLHYTISKMPAAIAGRPASARCPGRDWRVQRGPGPGPLASPSVVRLHLQGVGDQMHLQGRAFTSFSRQRFPVNQSDAVLTGSEGGAQ